MKKNLISMLFIVLLGGCSTTEGPVDADLTQTHDQTGDAVLDIITDVPTDLADVDLLVNPDIGPDLTDLFSELPETVDVPDAPDATEEVDSGPLCGDGECAETEDCEICPDDCGLCTDCGNGLCEAGQPLETPESCPEDCGPCGDGVCGPKELEEDHYCAIDCASVCGNGICDLEENDDADSPGYCPPDCGGCGDGCCGYQDLYDPELAWCQGMDCTTGCGNGVCSNGESYQSCPVDCGWCGDGLCGLVFDAPEPCPEDCTTPCGDGLCKGLEDEESCPMDCGPCGDGVCSLPEMADQSCYQDCPEFCGDNICGPGENEHDCPADCACLPVCEADWECGPDASGCWQECGACPQAAICLEHQCCVPDSCKNKQCGDDGCGGNCGFCPDGLDCLDFQCQDPICVPSCDGKECGDNGCGGICGACDDGLFCTDDICTEGVCHFAPVPLYCLIDGECKVSGVLNAASPCTKCQPLKAQMGWSSVTDGMPCGGGDICIAGSCCSITTNCDGAQCGSDGCGGSCGTCAEGFGCEDGACVEGVDCHPECEGKSCGPDNCGGSCGDCDDGLYCTFDICLFGQCQYDIAPLYCVLDDQCHASGTGSPGSSCKKCLPALSQLTWSDAPDGILCNDQNPCTTGDFCQAGECSAVLLTDCDDANPCTDDTCQAEVGCEYLNNHDVCDDGDACTENDNCLVGVCQSDPIECDDLNQCTGDSCDSVLGCQHPVLMTGTVCSDGDSCTSGDACDDGTCVSGATKNCTDEWACTIDSCDPDSGVCMSVADNIACEDANSCTTDTCSLVSGCLNPMVVDGLDCGAGNVCTGGVCGPPGVCPDGNAVEWDGCNNSVFAEFQVNTTTANDQREPKVAILAGGGFAVVWESRFQDGGDYGIYLRVFDEVGAPVTGEVQVNQSWTSAQKNPDIATLMDGRMVVVWDGSSATDAEGISGRIMNADGTPSTDEFLLHEAAGKQQQLASVGATLAGGFAAMWSSPEDGEWGDDIVAARFNSSGEQINSPIMLNTAGQGIRRSSNGVSLFNGYYVVTWTHLDFMDPSIKDSYWRLFDSVGVPVDNERLLGIPPASGGRSGSVVTSFGSGLDGGFAIAWTDIDIDADDVGVAVQTFAANGASTGPVSLVNNLTVGPQELPAVAGYSDGFVVTYSGIQDDGFGAEVKGVFGQRFDAEGKKDGPDFSGNLYLPGSGSWHNDVAAWPDGSIVMVWQTEDQDGDGWGVFASRFSASGEVCGRYECGIDMADLCPPGTCDDGMFCTDDICDPLTGDCYNFASDTLCDDGNDCTDDSCLEVSNSCEHLPLNDTPCDDENVCTLGDVCKSGVCSSVLENLCNDDNACTVDSCDPITGCSNLSGAEAACDDQDTCTSLNYCSNLGCLYNLTVDGKACSDNGACWEGQCEDLSQCDDGNASPWDGCNMAVGGSIDMISEFQVNTHTDGAQQYPAVTGLLEGDWVVVWLSLFQDGLTFSVRGLRYSGATGAKAGVEFMLNENTNVFRDEPDLAPLPDGGFVTVWSDGPTSNDANIVYRQYGNTGSPLGGPQVINTFTDNYQRYPAVASKSDGNFVVVWSSYLQDGDALGVFGQRMRMSLGAIGPEFPVNTTTTDIQWNSEVAYLPDGGFVVVWESKNQDEPGGYGVYARVWDLNGIAVTDEIPVNTFTGSDQRYPSLAVSTDGRFLVVWESWNQSGFGSDLYGQWFNTDFEPTGDELHLNSFLLDNQRRPVITSLDGGDLVLLYAGSGKHAHTGTHLRRLDAAGQPLAFDSRVNRNQFDNGTVWYQDIAPLADGGFVTVWQAGGDQDGESFGVFAARYNANGIRIYAGP